MTTVPIASVNPGLLLFFDRLVLLTRVFGRRFLAGRQTDQRGFTGAVNLVFAPGGAAWHCVLSEGGIRFHRGQHPQPLGTVRLSEETFFKLLTNQTSYFTAEMTGKVRVDGDGHCSFLLSSIILQAVAQTRRKGLYGWLARRHLHRVIRRSGTGFPSPA